eukprot:5011542-Pleurochrysis_carterae.AAC.1
MPNRSKGKPGAHSPPRAFYKLACVLTACLGGVRKASLEPRTRIGHKSMLFCIPYPQTTEARQTYAFSQRVEQRPTGLNLQGGPRAKCPSRLLHPSQGVFQ